MSSRARNVALFAVAAVAALVPLYGDPRAAPITHPEWARMMLRGMDMDAALETSASASRVFSILSWRDSLWLPASHYMRGSGVALVPGEKEPGLTATAELGEVVYPLTVMRRGEYRLRARMAGDPTTPAIAEIAEAESTEPEESFTLVPGREPTWLAPGAPMRLEPGTYFATFALPRGTRLDEFEIAPPCLTAIEPLGGWKPADVLDAEDLATTLVKALDREHELPPADVPIEINGSDFRLEDDAPVVLQASASPEDGLWLRSGANGTRAVLTVDLPAEGLYTLSVFGQRGRGQQWFADSCRMAVLCPAPAGEEPPGWHPVMSAEFAKGRHHFAVTLAPHSSIERVRLERKKATGPDYVDTIRRIGFDPGEGPVSRGKAADAMGFLGLRYPIDVGEPCEQIVIEQPTSQVALAQAAAAGVPGGITPINPFPGVTPPLVNGPNVPPPTLPCVPPASPVVPDPCPTP
jgi:hypothetical protein